MHRFTSLLLPVLLAATIAAPATGAAQSRNAILVLDASGSMWGEVDGRPKIEIARETVASVVNTLPEGTRLGLMAYGHNRKGDCTDIELLLPVEAVEGDRFLSTVEEIQPKGKTPLTTAVEMAAQRLRISEEPASVILVTDGIETCGGDPCALAEELAEAGIDFSTHVIAFDLASEEAESIRCLADDTGGLFLEAGDRDGLERALESTLDTLAEKPSGADLLARDSATDEPLAGAAWVVREAGPDGGPVALLDSPAGSVELDPGEYAATAEWQDRTRRVEFTVAEGRKTPVEVAFGPATLRLAAAESRDSTPIQRGLRWMVWSLDEDGETGDEPVESVFTAQPEFQLESGDYRVTVDYGDGSASLDVALADGASESRLVITGSGTITVSSERNGEPLESGRRYRLFPVNADGEPEDEALASQFTRSPSFVVPEGRYLVTAKDGPVRSEEMVELDAGERVDVVLSFSTGVLTVSATRAGEPLGDNRRYHVLRDGDEIENRYGKIESFTLPPGDYVVRAGDGPVTAEAEATIEPGETTEVVLNFETGVVTARATHDGEPVGGSGRFNVHRAEDGEKVESQFTRDVDFVLPPGDYEMRYDGGAGVGRAAFSIRSGETTELEVPVEPEE